MAHLINFNAYTKKLVQIQTSYTNATLEEIKSVIYTPGEVRLYKQMENQEKKQDNPKYIEIVDFASEFNNKSQSKYTHCDTQICEQIGKCNLSTIYNQNSKTIHQGHTRNRDHDLTQKFHIITADHDISISEQNMQYLQCRNNHYKQAPILYYARNIVVPSNMIDSCPKVMVKYLDKHYEVIYSITREFWITESVVCIIIYLLISC